MAKFPVSGKDIPEIDLKKISVREWRSMFDFKQPDHEGDNILARVSGYTVDEIRDLPLPDYRTLVQTVIEENAKPLENDKKNSASAST